MCRANDICQTDFVGAGRAWCAQAATEGTRPGSQEAWLHLSGDPITLGPNLPQSCHNCLQMLYIGTSLGHALRHSWACNVNPSALLTPFLHYWICRQQWPRHDCSRECLGRQGSRKDLPVYVLSFWSAFGQLGDLCYIMRLNDGHNGVSMLALYV